MNVTRNRIAALFRKTRKVGQCRIWLGARAGKDYQYPYAKVDGRSVGVHRVVFTFYRGTIPWGYDVHHTCPHTLCIVPHHLQSVPPKKHRTKRNSWKAKRGHC